MFSFLPEVGEGESTRSSNGKGGLAVYRRTRKEKREGKRRGRGREKGGEEERKRK